MMKNVKQNESMCINKMNYLYLQRRAQAKMMSCTKSAPLTRWLAFASVIFFKLIESSSQLVAGSQTTKCQSEGIKPLETLKEVN